MAVKENQPDEAKVKKMIDDLVKKAKIASQEYMKLDQKTVNNIIKAMWQDLNIIWNLQNLQ